MIGKVGNNMEKIDYKQLNKELYVPKSEAVSIEVPAMKFIMVDGHGNPNEEGGEYMKAVELLYALSYTIKMGNKKNADPAFFDYVVPPLEGLWWLEDISDMDFTQKEKYHWTSMIRQPEFVDEEMFQQACAAVIKKNPGMEVIKAKLQVYEEGLCVQCMHLGPFATEDITLEKMEAYISKNGFIYNIGNTSPNGIILRHHEIYLSDPRKGNPANMRTVLRHPVRRKE
jgi:hypothetical protein